MAKLTIGFVFQIIENRNFHAFLQIPNFCLFVVFVFSLSSVPPNAVKRAHPDLEFQFTESPFPMSPHGDDEVYFFDELSVVF